MNCGECGISHNHSSLFSIKSVHQLLLLLLLAYAFSCANGTGDRDSYEFGQLVRSFAGAPDG